MHCTGCSTKAKLESSRWITQGQAGPPFCKSCRQRLWMLRGGYLFAKHPRLQRRHRRHPNKQHKTLCKLLWSCVCIGIQSGDLWEQPTLHKPAGLKIAQEPQHREECWSHWATVVTKSFLLHKTLARLFLIPASVISSCTKRTRGTTESLTCWLISSIYMSHHSTHTHPQLIAPCLAIFQSISSLLHEDLQQAKAIWVTLYCLVWTPECELKMG